MAYIKINKENLFYNLKVLSLKAGSVEKIAAVLKDNAYGHGIELMAKLLSSKGVKEAVVIDINEAKKIEEYFENILILNDTTVKNAKFSFAITSINALKNVSKEAKIELKIDSGMHRNGISLNEVKEAIDIIKQRGLKLFGVFTHFKSADEFSSELFWQKKNFENVKKSFLKASLNPRFHSHNSAALLRSQNFSEDIARVGIGLYGYNEVPKIYNTPQLKPLLSLWAKKVSTRKLLKGQRVGYGGDFTAPKDMIISTYDVGYGDGLFRGDAKKPLTISDGLPILGRVSMDFISLESTKDELCIFDDAKKVAKHFNTISYEVLTALKERINRVVV